MMPGKNVWRHTKNSLKVCNCLAWKVACNVEVLTKMQENKVSQANFDGCSFFKECYDLEKDED